MPSDANFLLFFLTLFIIIARISYASFVFSFGFTSHMVLQRAPYQAMIYGISNVSSVQFSMSLERTGAIVFSTKLNTTDSTWRVLLPAMQPPVPDDTYTMTISAMDPNYVGPNASLNDILFGDVIACMGQSNMWLPMSYTLSRYEAFNALRKGHYKNVRFFNYGAKNDEIYSGSNKPLWVSDPSSDKLRSSLSWIIPTNETLNVFASTCWYTGQELIDRRKGTSDENVPVGLLHSAIGGTQIGQWAEKGSLQAKCTQLAKTKGGWGGLFNIMVAPFLNMTVKAVLWYQGENDLGAKIAPGNVLEGTGYACSLVTIVTDWRQLWSSTPGTTASNVPFGIFTIAPGGSEGDTNGLPPFRLAQTGNYGQLPSPSLPNTFLIPTHDLGDPCDKHSSAPKCVCNGTYTYKHCTNSTPYDRPVTPFRDSRIHPRDKRPVGMRAGMMLHSIFTDEKGVHPSGPVLSGCTLNRTNAFLDVYFNVSRLAGGKVVIRSPYPITTKKWSAMEVQTFIIHESRKQIAWVSVNVSSIGPETIRLDLSTLANATSGTETVFAVRYAWAENACCAGQSTCDPSSCPLWTSGVNTDLLPAIPFLANITSKGKCNCTLPQLCNM